jgi:hypothetical protein
MHILGTIEEAKGKVLADAKRCMERIRNVASLPFNTPSEAVQVLQRIRSETYEDLNQIQHEHLILCAAEWLLAQGICDHQTRWHWNPRQTGDYAEPDLMGISSGATVLSAEITTSAKPVGVIDTRMQKTLAKLAQQNGELYYFVQTQAMASRANTKVRKAGWKIRVVQLP